MHEARHMQSPTAPLRPSHLQAERLVQHLAVSGDGNLLAYSVRVPTPKLDGYRSRLVVVDAATGETVQRTDGDHRDGLPTFMPDGNAVVFVSDRDESPQAFALAIASGEVSQLTDLPAGVRSAEPTPDGRRLLCLAPSGEERFRGEGQGNVRVIEDLNWRADGIGVRDQFTSAWMWDLARGEATRLTDPGYEVFAACWRPDGGGINFLADRSPGAALEELPQAWRLAFDDGHPRALCSLPGSVWAIATSSSGTVAYAGIADPGAPFWAWANMRVFVQAEDGGRELPLDDGATAANATFTDLIDVDGTLYPQLEWLDDEHVVTLSAQRGSTHPVVLGLDGSRTRLGDAGMICYRLATGGGRLAFAASRGGEPGDVYVAEADTVRRLGHEGDWLGDRRLEPRRFAWSAPKAGERAGWLVEAEGTVKQPGPLVLHVHGGPYAAHGPTPWLDAVALAGAGIRVLCVNPPGSLGYGVEHAQALSAGWGRADEEYFLSALGAAVEAGIAEPTQIGVMGLSYGGFATLWLAGRHPDWFAAALCENPPADFLSWAGTSDFGMMTGPRGMDLGDLPEAAAEHASSSAFAQLTGDVPPLLLIQSEQDLRCPAGQTDIVFSALRRRGKQVTMVRYPDEPHGMVAVGRPDRRIDRLARVLGFFTRHLGADVEALERPRVRVTPAG